MLSVCVSEFDTFTTPERCGDIHAIQSFLSSAIAINADAFACESKIVAPPLGPCRIKLIVYSAGFLRRYMSYNISFFNIVSICARVVLTPFRSYDLLPSTLNVTPAAF